MQYVSSIA